MKWISICDVAGSAILALVTRLQVLSQRASEPYQRCRLGPVWLAAVIGEISLAWGFVHMTLPRLSVFSGSSTFAAAKISCFLSFLEALDTVMAAVPHPWEHFPIYKIRWCEFFSSNRNLSLLLQMMMVLVSFSAQTWAKSHIRHRNKVRQPR